MGAATSPHPTDETMVESCPEEPPSSCCGPHVFTSVLLGVLACVLMTGGVFLAFHRWDPLWLIVSGIGVILVLIGSILHCCRVKQPVAGKGCCLPDHLHNHVVLNGGSLTEQLLPLSNARSVSQLSLNMLPGYFPPVVATYGIEQHSAVVQNINRIIQQQTQSPAVTGSPGKSFILLSLPGNTPQANIQNLVATVYQLDGSVLAETSTATNIPAPTTTSTTAPSSPIQSNIPILRNVEVQTCAAWSVPNSANVAMNMPSTSNAHIERSNAIMATQTDDLQQLVAINLMDCSPDPICDTPSSPTSQVDLPSPDVLVNVSTDTTSADGDTRRTSVVNAADPSIDTLLEISTVPSPVINIPNTSSDVLIDISESSSSSNNNPSDANIPSTNSVSNSDVNHSIPSTSNTTEVTNSADIATVCVESPTIVSNNCVEQITANNGTELSNGHNNIAIASTSTGQAVIEFTASQADHSESSSLSVVDIEDCESLGRSSPPPSYEDVALQNDGPVGVFGLAYGTL